MGHASILRFLLPMRENWLAWSCTKQNTVPAKQVLTLRMTQPSHMSPCAEQTGQPAQRHLGELCSDGDVPSASYGYDPTWKGFKLH